MSSVEEVNTSPRWKLNRTRNIWRITVSAVEPHCESEWLGAVDVGDRPKSGGEQSAGSLGQSAPSLWQHPAARDEAIKNAWLRPDGVSLRREGQRERKKTEGGKEEMEQHGREVEK